MTIWKDANPLIVIVILSWSNMWRFIRPPLFFIVFLGDLL